MHKCNCYRIIFFQLILQHSIDTRQNLENSRWFVLKPAILWKFLHRIDADPKTSHGHNSETFGRTLTLQAFSSMSLCHVFTVGANSLWPLCCADLDACSIHPCQNGGMCLPVDSSYVCSCAQGYTGVDCDSSKLTCWYIVSGGRFFHFIYEYKFLTSLSILQWKKCSAKKSSW